MEIETLDIFKIIKKQDILKFEEYLHTDGSWVKTYSDSLEWEGFVKLDYCSALYDFYLCQDTGGKHFMYRCKK